MGTRLTLVTGRDKSLDEPARLPQSSQRDGFDPETSKTTKERLQLHKMLERYTWVGGSNDPVASDKSLTPFCNTISAASGTTTPPRNPKPTMSLFAVTLARQASLT